MSEHEAEVERRLWEILKEENLHRNYRRRAFASGSEVVSSSVKLTNDFVSRLGAGEREFAVRDTLVDRLSLRVRSNGTKSYYLIYPANGSNAQRKVCIGSAEHFSVEQARCLALEAMERELEEGSPKRGVKLPKGATVDEAVQLYTRTVLQKLGPNHARNTRNRLQEFVVVHSGQALTKLRKAHFLSLLHTVGLGKSGRSRAMFKVLRAFLAWSVKAGAIESNPLARTTIRFQSRRSSRFLDVEELSAIFLASQRTQQPWMTLIGVLMLTGETVETVRYLHASQVRLRERVWSVEPCPPWSQPSKWLPLSSDAAEMLEALPMPRDYFFKSPRPGCVMPIHLRPSVLQQLQRDSGVHGWSWRDLVRSTRVAMAKVGQEDTRYYRNSIHAHRKCAPHRSWADVLRSGSYWMPEPAWSGSEVVL